MYSIRYGSKRVDTVKNEDVKNISGKKKFMSYESESLHTFNQNRLLFPQYYSHEQLKPTNLLL